MPNASTTALPALSAQDINNWLEPWQASWQQWLASQSSSKETPQKATKPQKHTAVKPAKSANTSRSSSPKK